jgi:hypothetical protein
MPESEEKKLREMPAVQDDIIQINGAKADGYNCRYKAY